MSDLLDLVGDLAGGMLEPGLRRRGAAAPEPPPTPPGIPALPPDPRLISQGLAAIRAHDPGFDETRVLARARAIWTQGGGTGETLRGLALSSAQPGPQRERLTVRLELAGAHGGVGEEDWVFERSATATTEDTDAAGHCPTCGAPLQASAASACPYCHASLLGTSTWVLAERLRLRPMTDRDATALALVAAVGSGGAATAATPAPPPRAAGDGVDLAVLGPGVEPHDLLATAREIVYAVAAARSQRHPELVAGRVTPEFGAALRDEAAALAARRRHHVLAFLEVSEAVINAAAAEGPGVRVTVRVRLTGEEYELSDAGLELVEGTQTMRSWTEDWTLVRAGAAEPWCAASSERVSAPPGSA